MKRFLFRLFKFLLLFLSVFFVLFSATNVLISSGDFYELNNDIKYIIAGHSHSQCAFDDSKIEHAINISQVGEAYLYTYLKVKKIIEENDQVEVVFLEYSNNQIDPLMNNWTWEDSYLMNKFPKYQFLMGGDEYKILLSENFKGVLRSLPKSLIRNIAFFSKQKNILKGMNWGNYLQLKRNQAEKLAKEAPDVQQSKNVEVSEVNLKYLFKLIDFLKKSNVKVVLVRSPLHPKYYALQNEPKFKMIYEKELNDHVFLDYINFPLENNSFGDLEHLNTKGASIFSRHFNNELKLNHNY